MTKPHPGHRFWELNISKGTIMEIVLGSELPELDKTCLYCWALNAYNADKKFIKMIKTYVGQNKTDLQAADR